MIENVYKHLEYGFPHQAQGSGPLRIDRERRQRGTLRTAIGEMKIITTIEGLPLYPINLRVARDRWQHPEELRRVLIMTSTGAQVPTEQGPVRIGFIALIRVAVEIRGVRIICLDRAFDEKQIEKGRQDRDGLHEAVLTGASTRVRPIIKTAAAIIGGLLPIMWGTETGSRVMKRIAAPMVEGMVTATRRNLVEIAHSHLHSLVEDYGVQLRRDRAHLETMVRQLAIRTEYWLRQASPAKSFLLGDCGKCSRAAHRSQPRKFTPKSCSASPLSGATDGKKTTLP